MDVNWSALFGHSTPEDSAMFSDALSPSSVSVGLIMSDTADTTPFHFWPVLQWKSQQDKMTSKSQLT